MEIILASGSPRRRELLGMIVDTFRVEVSGADENLGHTLPPRDFVARLAGRKAAEVAGRFPEAVVIGADTVVELDGVMLGKPRDAADAADMLRRLAGREHRVHTAVSVHSPLGQRGIVSTAAVRFAQVAPEEINWYIATGEPMDKAGAYGIQGFASRYITGIQGDYYTVMGLPVQPLYQLLRDWGILDACREKRM